MCDVIEPIGLIKPNTHLLLKRNKSPRMILFEERNIDVEYEVFYLLSFHLGPDWTLGGVYYGKEEDVIPDNIEYDSFDAFFVVATKGNVVICRDGVQRLEDYRDAVRREGVFTSLTTYNVEYVKESVYEANEDAAEITQMILINLQSDFIIAKVFSKVPRESITPKNGKESDEEYVRRVKTVYDALLKLDVLPLNEGKVCKVNDKDVLTVVMSFWPRVIHDSTPEINEPFFDDANAHLMEELEKANLYPPPGTLIHYQSHLSILPESDWEDEVPPSLQATFTDFENFYPLGTLEELKPYETKVGKELKLKPSTHNGSIYAAKISTIVEELL